tara:strand:+ start:949 stop:1110 length:162 start_codon:yes stop_codon:yes gene_type:complete
MEQWVVLNDSKEVVMSTDNLMEAMSLLEDMDEKYDSSVVHKYTIDRLALEEAG